MASDCRIGKARGTVVPCEMLIMAKLHQIEKMAAIPAMYFRHQNPLPTSHSRLFRKCFAMSCKGENSWKKPMSSNFSLVHFLHHEVPWKFRTGKSKDGFLRWQLSHLTGQTVSKMALIMALGDGIRIPPDNENTRECGTRRRLYPLHPLDSRRRDRSDASDAHLHFFQLSKSARPPASITDDFSSLLSRNEIL